MLVDDADPADVELGLACLGEAPLDRVALMRAPGTLKNWRDAIKRVWHASMHDVRVHPKPETLADLLRTDCLTAAVRAIRDMRRQRVEAQGKSWEDNIKGRYEFTLIYCLISIGRVMHLPEETLDMAREFACKIDPSIIGSKIKADGKIGPRHSEMLKALNETSVLKRWFEASDKLWSLALAPVRRGQAPTLRHAALARTALTLRIDQRVCPL